MLSETARPCSSELNHSRMKVIFVLIGQSYFSHGMKLGEGWELGCDFILKGFLSDVNSFCSDFVAWCI